MILQITKKTEFIQKDRVLTSQGNSASLQNERTQKTRNKEKNFRIRESKPREMREFRVPFRVFPANGKPGCYTILFASSYRTEYGFYDVLGEAIPEEVAILVLQSVHERMKNPIPIDLHTDVSVRCAMSLAGADVWGRKCDTWWHDLASDESVLEGNGGEEDGCPFRIPNGVWKNLPYLN